METINRMAISVSFKENFVSWINNLPDANKDIRWNLGMLNKDKNVYLVPAYELQEEAEEWLEAYRSIILAEAFDSICTEEKWWPTKPKFEDYLTIEWHQMVFDLVADEPIVQGS